MNTQTNLHRYLDSLNHFIQNNKPLMLVLGEASEEKTTLFSHFISENSLSRELAEIKGDENLTTAQFIAALTRRWEAPIDKSSTNYREVLDQFLTSLNERDASVIVIIHDADQLPLSTLSAISHLSIKQEGRPVSIYFILAGGMLLHANMRSLQNREIPFIRLEDRVPVSSVSEPMLTSPKKYEDVPIRATKESNQKPPADKHWIKSISLVLLVLVGLFLWHHKKMGHSVSKTDQQAVPVASITHSIEVQHPDNSTVQPTIPKAHTSTIEHTAAPGNTASLSSTPVPKNLTEAARTEAAKPLQEKSVIETMVTTKPIVNLNKPSQPVSVAISASAPQPSVTPNKAPILKSKPANSISIATPKAHSVSIKKQKKKLTVRSTPLYTLQLLGSHQPIALRAFITQHHLGTAAHVLRTAHAGKTWYIVVFGQYHTHDDAKKAILALKRNHPELQPWIRLLPTPIK